MKARAQTLCNSKVPALLYVSQRYLPERTAAHVIPLREGVKGLKVPLEKRLAKGALEGHSLTPGPRLTISTFFFRTYLKSNLT